MTKGKLKNKMLLITILPLIMVGIVSIAVTARQFVSYSKSMAETSLGQSAKTMSAVMDQLYDGDYNISDTSGKRVLMKGDYVFNGRIELFDTLKKDTGLEYSLFFENTRVATTLKKNSDFMLGTVMDP